jgi:hypothetical protein
MSKLIETVTITKAEEKAMKHILFYYNRTFGENAENKMLLEFTKRKINWIHPPINSFWNRLSLKEFTLIFIFKHYEVEKSKEEKLLEYYNSLESQVYGFGYGANYVKRTLKILDIKVKGTNA